MAAQTPGPHVLTTALANLRAGDWLRDLPVRWPLLALLLLAPAAAFAQGFSAQIMPPRFEDRAQPGGVFRDVIEVANISPVASRMKVSTADWVLDEKGTAQFSSALAPGSCRPWVGLEAAEVRIEPNSRKRFRFEVAVPANAPSGQCRFAIMIEGELAGCVGFRRGADAIKLDSFYLHRRYHNSGLGTTILKVLLDEADATDLPVRLDVLTGSKADRFYLRHGFMKLREDEIEGYYERPAPSARA